MIKDTDRSGYIGASDTKYVMGNWKTETFAKWWRVKQGLDTSKWDNIYTLAGNAYEGKILDYLEVDERDEQIINGRLRVNLDGIKGDCIVEVKTHKAKVNWKPEKAYIQQVQVQMYAKGFDQAIIAAYEMADYEYDDYSCEIDPERLAIFYYDYDQDFIYTDYLPREAYLAECLEKGLFPDEGDFEEYRSNDKWIRDNIRCWQTRLQTNKQS